MGGSNGEIDGGIDDGWLHGFVPQKKGMGIFPWPSLDRYPSSVYHRAVKSLKEKRVMLTPKQKEKVLGAFPDADLDMIESIIYFDGWSSYEECGGILIFVGIDGSCQKVNYGTSVFSSDPSTFTPNEITLDEAAEDIKQMVAYLSTYEWPVL